MLTFLICAVALADDVLILEGEAPDDGLDHFFVPFEVPAGTAEVQVHLDDGSSANILDWGVNDPNGWRGWGGGNSEPAVLNAEAASRSYLPGPIPAGTWQVVVGKAKLGDPPGAYTIEVVLRDAPTLAPQTDRQPWAPPAPLDDAKRWYAGDLHVHSNESGDARATLDEIAELARERGLDFVVVTDHNTVSHLDWLADAQDRHPDVLLIPGIEFTTYNGHANALGATAWVDHKIGQPGVTIQAAAAAFAEQGALLSINHPTLDLGDLCIGCAWDHEIPDPLAAVEVATGGLSSHGGLFTWTALDFWDALCADGRRLAAVGGSDDHRAGVVSGPYQSPIGDPTTLVWADELSVHGILGGIAAGRTVVKLQGPDDPMVSIEAHGRTVGDEFPVGTALTATVTGGEGLTLRWIVDGQRRPSVAIDADPFTDTLDIEAEGRVRAEVHRDGNPLTVTSHVWAVPAVERRDDPRGCGCGGGRAALLFLPLALLLARRRR